MSRSDQDRVRLQQALTLAHAAIGITEPNPRVGCVVGTESGLVFGSGATQEAGGPHAEVMALRAAQLAAQDVRGGTAWVTLEPCAHHGRTPPCCDALIAAGLGRVVVAMEDPFPAVAGAGIARLRAAGINVEMAEASVAASAYELNIGFFSRVARGRPWLRVKVAMSLDGRTGLDNGISQWITSEAARADGHAWRRRASAVLTGVGTVLADDPLLNVRLGPSPWQPLRVVVDSHLRTPVTARLLSPPGEVLVVTTEPADSEGARALRSRGAQVLTLPAIAGRVDLRALLVELAARGVNELHAEAGAGLNTALVRQGLADELLVYMAPRLLGGGRGVVQWPELDRLEQGAAFAIFSATQVGPDLCLRLRPCALTSARVSELVGSSADFTAVPTPERGV